MTNKKRKFAAIFLAVIMLVTLSGCGLKQTNPTPYSLQLEVWGLFDDTDAYSGIFETYSKLNPQIVKVNYRKLTPDTYKRDLLDALASGQGPDIFLIQNTWLPMFKNKIVAAPADILGMQKFNQNFVDVAINDFTDKDGVEAVPLSVDSLGLYYNKDLFNQAGITQPPKTWDELVLDSEKLTKNSPDGQIAQAGVALGTTANINRSMDILTLMMLQNGTKMTDDARMQATFDSISMQNNVSVSPGANALDFYSKFAKSTSPFYAWNSKLHYSTDAFSEGTLAMMFGYSYLHDTITNKAPKLNFDVAPVPQLVGSAPVDYANYWGFAVAKNKVTTKSSSASASAPIISNDTRVKEAWKLLDFLTTKQVVSTDATANAAANAARTKKGIPVNYDPAVDYLTNTQKPAARKDLIEQQKTDPRNGVFAVQNLIAKSWYEVDPDVIDGLLAEMITQVNTGQATVADALKAATARVTQLMRSN